MKRSRILLGLLTGGILVLSSVAHTALGWPTLAGQLAALNVPADLALGLQVGWYFAGVAILTFGLLVLHHFDRARRDPAAAPAPLPMLLLGFVYFGFGAWALAVSRDPFFFIFVMPGTMLLAAAWPEEAPAVREEQVEERVEAPAVQLQA